MTGTANPNTIAHIASLIGDPARAVMLSALMGGQALAAGELAAQAGITAQTASGHLARLIDAGLLAVERQGRHRYYRLATAAVPEALHALMLLAASGPTRHQPPGPRDRAMRLARTCYDHMAGRLAVALTDHFSASGYLTLADGVGLVSPTGRHFFADLGLALEDAPTRRPFCRTCMDWSERRLHLAGTLGAALLDRFLALDWVTRSSASRALTITPAGDRDLLSHIGLPADWRTPPSHAR